jgi:hypothetical protein
MAGIHRTMIRTIICLFALLAICWPSAPAGADVFYKDVPFYDQSGSMGGGCEEPVGMCAQTAIAMILGWYDSHDNDALKVPTVPNWKRFVPFGGSSQEKNCRGVNKLHELIVEKLLTGDDGVLPWEASYIKKHFSDLTLALDSGANFTADRSSILQITTWQNIKDALNNYYVGSLGMGIYHYYYEDKSYYFEFGGHAVAARGYFENKKPIDIPPEMLGDRVSVPKIDITSNWIAANTTWHLYVYKENAAYKETGIMWLNWDDIDVSSFLSYLAVIPNGTPSTATDNTDDAYEDNDRFEDAKALPIESGRFSASNLKLNDIDLYKITPQVGSLDITVTSNANIGIVLFDKSGKCIYPDGCGSVFNSVSSTNSIHYDVANSNDNYFIHVYPITPSWNGTDITEAHGNKASYKGDTYSLSIVNDPPPPITPPTADPQLRVSPDTITFSATAGGSNPDNQYISITNAGGGTLSWTATTNQNWLSLSAGYGYGPLSPTVSVNISGLTANTYQGKITVTSSGSSGSTKEIPVTLVVSQNQSPNSPPPVADTYTYGKSMGSNYGTATSLLVGREAIIGGYTPHNGFIKFDVSSLSGKGSSIASAKLRLYCTSAHGSDYIQVSRILTNWDEYTLLGTNAINYTGSKTSSISSTGWKEWDVTAFVQDWTKQTSPSPNYGFKLQGYSGEDNYFNFNSREASNNKPELIVTICDGTPNLSLSKPRPDNGMTAPPFYVGQTVDWYVTVSNTGSGCASNYTVRYYLGDTPLDTSSPKEINSESGTSLFGGMSKDKHDSYTFTTLGTKYLNVKLDGSSTVKSYGPFDVIQKPSLSVDRATVDFTGMQGGQNPTFQVVNITNMGGGTLNWSASSTASWLTILPLSGQGAASPRIAVDLTGLTAGEHNGNITITASGAEGSPTTIPVKLVITAVPEIDVKQGSVQISSGSGNYDFGSANIGASLPKTFTIQNLGYAALNLSGNPPISITGANAADFAVTVQPTTPISPSGNVNFTVTFTPLAPDSRYATLSIGNNDSDENPYSFTITGTGVTFCTAPGVPASITYPSTDTDGSFDVTWSAVSGATGYTLERSTTSGFSSGVTTIVTNQNVTTYSQTGLSGGMYYYRVRAHSSTTCYSNWKTGTSVSIATRTVTPSAGSGGSISPSTQQIVNYGSTTSFTVTPNSGYTASVGGTCGGYPTTGTEQFTYTTNAITANCTVTATFTSSGTAATPTFSPDSSSQPGTSVSVTASCTTSGATIRYTTDGTEPTESSPIVSSGGSVTVPVPGTLKAKAWKSGLSASGTKTASYTSAGTVDKLAPTLSITSHASGSAVNTSSITLSGTATDSGRGNNGIKQVTVNGTRASGDTATGSGTANWSKSISLNTGANTITVVAYDNYSAPNQTTQTITINYSAGDPEIPVFKPYTGNPIISSYTTPVSKVVKVGNEYRGYFVESNSSGTYPADFNVDIIKSTDGITWGLIQRNIISSQQTGQTFNYNLMELKVGDTYKAWHSATSDWMIAWTKLYYSTSPNGITYTAQGMILDNSPSGQ